MKKRYFSFLLAGMLTVALALSSNPGFSAVIYVDQNAAGANDGSSWADAYTDLQDALMAANPGDEIWVSGGMYRPSVQVDFNASGGTDAREAVFALPSEVALYGGFSGTEGSIAERDWETNLTILSGDIDNNDQNGDGNSIAETTDDLVGSNAYHVIYTENADPSTRLDGFVVTAGKADIAAPVDVNDPNLDGGGWYNRLSSPLYASSPTIVNVSFNGNYAVSEGGAFYTIPGPAGAESSSIIENCLFSGNKSDNTAGAIYIGSFNPGDYQLQILNCRFVENSSYRRGGAIYMVGDHLELTSSTFTGNSVTAVSPDMSTLPGSGGAVSLVASNAIFTECMFLSNSATGNPTGAYEGGGGGAVYASTNDPQTSSLGPSAPRFTGCGFYENYAGGNGGAWGGAVTYLNDGGILQPAFVNCVFSENEAQNHGGAIAGLTRVLSDPGGFVPLMEPQYTNCTFYGNQAGQIGGSIYHSGYMHDGSQVLQSAIVNSILWGNLATTDGNQIYNTGDLVISYSLVEGSGGSGAGWDTDLGTDGGNNIDGSAGFVKTASPLGADAIPATGDDGLRLTQFSSAVNEGNNAASGLTGITEDYTGGPRILGGMVDMGAYERSGIILPDFDLVWLYNWHEIQPPCLNCPLPWAFHLPDFFGFDPQYLWKEPAKFIRNDSSAVITGEIINAADPEISFRIHLELVKEQSWDEWSKRQGTWFSKTEASMAVAESEHMNWKFWRLSPASYLKGSGEVQGIIRMNHTNFPPKTGFQMGLGANAMDEDFGLAGDFKYQGLLKYNQHKIHVKGIGSLNADAVPCEENCDDFLEEPLAENKSGITATESSPDAMTGNKLLVYPVPANDYIVIESSLTLDKKSQVKIVEPTGQVLMTRTWDRQQNRYVMDLSELKSGFYLLQVELDGEQSVHRIVRQ